MGLATDEEASEDMRFAPAGSSLGVGIKYGVLGSSVRVVTVLSLLLTLFRPLRFLFCRVDMERSTLYLVCRSVKKGDSRKFQGRRPTNYCALIYNRLL